MERPETGALNSAYLRPRSSASCWGNGCAGRRCAPTMIAEKASDHILGRLG
jgi:hypothetical protein